MTRGCRIVCRSTLFRHRNVFCLWIEYSGRVIEDFNALLCYHDTVAFNGSCLTVLYKWKMFAHLYKKHSLSLKKLWRIARHIFLFLYPLLRPFKPLDHHWAVTYVNDIVEQPFYKRLIWKLKGWTYILKGHTPFELFKGIRMSVFISIVRNCDF